MFPSFEDFLVAESVQIPVVSFLVNLLLAALLAVVLGRVYVTCGTALSNRRLFARNFLLLTMTIMLVITIVKSSLALSLGLVGALSIVRYRAAIKEPEELAYLFLAIAIGLGFGANQGVVTLAAFLIIIGVIFIQSRFGERRTSPNLYLTVSTGAPQEVGLKEIVAALEKHCSMVSLRRFDETADGLEASFLVEYRNFDQVEAGRSALRELDKSVSVSLLDNRGML
jgi:uncharacterized membrane protein YhiD involved in acid resistance